MERGIDEEEVFVPFLSEAEIVLTENDVDEALSGKVKNHLLIYKENALLNQKGAIFGLL